MSKTLKRLKLADIRPLVDEYGNEYAQRDYSLDVNKKYVRELADSFGPSGEPEEIITVIPEEGVYYVKAGRTRYEAMKLRGTEECDAIVDDDTSRQAAIETIVRTDKKKKYEDVELSGFVQQLAAFGDDAYVSEVASIDLDKAQRVRKARDIIGHEKSEQLSLDRLYVIPDFEGDEDAVRKLIEAPEKKWERIAEDMYRKKENAEKVAAFKAEAKEFGVKIVDERLPGLRYACTCNDPGDLKADYMAASVNYKSMVAVLVDSWYVAMTLYGKPLNDEEESVEESERRRLADSYEKVATSIDDACFNFIVETLSDGDAREQLSCIPHLEKACRKVALARWWLTDSLKAFPMAKKEKGCLVLFAIGYDYARRRFVEDASGLAKDNIPDYLKNRIREALDWLDLHIADGFQLDENMSEFIDMAREKVAETADDGEDGDRE